MDEINYKHEYERYKKKVDQLLKQVRDMKEQEAGWGQLNEATLALVAATLAAFNVTGDNPITLDREAVSEAVNRLQTVCHYDADNEQYKMWVEKIEK